MTPALQQAIAGVYEAFRDVPRPRSVEGCPCCIDNKGISILLSKPLRDLTPGDLTHYAASAFLTVGDVADYLYFLPRILEIRATDEAWYPDPEIVARAVHTAGYHSWPDGRRQAVKRYVDEVVNDQLAADGLGFELNSWICALGILHVDLAPYLAAIAASGPRLIEFYEANSKQLLDGELSNAFWVDAPDECQQVIDWFRSAEIQKRIRAEYGMA